MVSAFILRFSLISILTTCLHFLEHTSPIAVHLFKFRVRYSPILRYPIDDVESIFQQLNKPKISAGFTSRPADLGFSRIRNQRQLRTPSMLPGGIGYGMDAIFWKHTSKLILIVRLVQFILQAPRSLQKLQLPFRLH